MLRPIWSHPECPTKEDIRESSGATDYPLLVAVSSGTNPCSGRRFVCNDLRQGYWRGLKLGLRSVRYARHRESGTIYQIQTCEARSLRCRVETVFIGGLIRWVLQRGGLFQCLARAALPLLRRRPKRCRSRLRNNHGSTYRAFRSFPANQCADSAA